MPINIWGNPGDCRHFFNYMSLEFQAYFWFYKLVKDKKTAGYTENKANRVRCKIKL